MRNPHKVTFKGGRAATAGRPYTNTVLIPLAVITPLSFGEGLGGEAGEGVRLHFSRYLRPVDIRLPQFPQMIPQEAIGGKVAFRIGINDLLSLIA